MSLAKHITNVLGTTPPKLVRVRFNELAFEKNASGDRTEFKKGEEADLLEEKAYGLSARGVATILGRVKDGALVVALPPIDETLRTAEAPRPITAQFKSLPSDFHSWWDLNERARVDADQYAWLKPQVEFLQHQELITSSRYDRKAVRRKLVPLWNEMRDLEEAAKERQGSRKRATLRLNCSKLLEELVSTIDDQRVELKAIAREVFSIRVEALGFSEARIDSLFPMSALTARFIRQQFRPPGFCLGGTHADDSTWNFYDLGFDEMAGYYLAGVKELGEIRALLPEARAQLKAARDSVESVAAAAA